MLDGPYLVLLTGHPGAGKSTLAAPLATALGAVALSKDQVRYRVFDGWVPEHPVFAGRPTLEVGDARFDEDGVVWSIFFWAVEAVVAVAPVVAETAMTRPGNRADVARFLATVAVPLVEVVLRPPQPVLLQQYAARRRSPDAHRIYRTFPEGTEHALLAQPYRPLLEPGRVIEVTDAPGAIDVDVLAARVKQRI